MHPDLRSISLARVLFLDIDGVVVTRRKAMEGKGMPYNLVPEHRALFDERAMEQLARVIDTTHCAIVVSSTWRLRRTAVEFQNYFQWPVIDVTPDMRGHGCRGDEIKAYLDTWSKALGIQKYAIVDDDSDMLPEQRPFFVKTTFDDGLTEEAANKLIEILK